MDEHVVALLTRDEAVTLLGVEELHRTCGQPRSFPSVEPQTQATRRDTRSIGPPQRGHSEVVAHPGRRYPASRGR
jgi:hypothetical protein